MKENIFLGCPTHNGLMDHRSVNAMLCDATNRYDSVMAKVRTSSLLSHNCNTLYCDALNDRERLNLKWFAMIHADIIPEPLWLDKLVAIANAGDYDMLSVHSPLKSDEGLTSTALQVGDRLRRLTNYEIMHDAAPDEIESSFFDGAKYLLLNTGCMIVRIDQPWSHQLFFTITDAIVHRDGKFIPTVFSEDWHFSKLVQMFGGKVAATRQVKLKHIGAKGYSIDQVGQFTSDPEYKP